MNCVNGLVSVIMPMYNAETKIERAIKCVLNQTYDCFELLIVDDCSTDKSFDIAKSFCDPRIQLFKTPKNTGPAVARNLALGCAHGEWIAFLDADDVWYVDKLKQQIDFMLKNDIYFSCTAYKEILDGNPVSIMTAPLVIDRKTMEKCNFLGCLAVVYSRKKIGDIFVDERLRRRNDYAIWLQISKKEKCFFLNKILAEYSITSGSVSHAPKFSLFMSQMLLWKLQEGKSSFAAFFFSLRNALYTQIYKKKLYRKKIK